MNSKDKPFDVKVVTEVRDDSNPVFVGQEVTFLMSIRDEDNAAYDLTEVSAINVIVFKRVGDVRLTKTATFVNSGTDGEVKYTTVASDLDKAGTWKAQFIHTKASGEDVPGSVVTFKVLPRI